MFSPLIVCGKVIHPKHPEYGVGVAYVIDGSTKPATVTVEWNFARTGVVAVYFPEELENAPSRVGIKLVFEDWRRPDGDSCYNNEDGVNLSMGALHAGSTFRADIELSEEDQKTMEQALQDGYRPVFFAVADAEKTESKGD
jgi:hypothetical protein